MLNLSTAEAAAAMAAAVVAAAAKTTTTTTTTLRIPLMDHTTRRTRTVRVRRLPMLTMASKWIKYTYETPTL